MQNKRLHMLTESALMLALAMALALVAVFKLPNGGSVTVGSMLPIMLISFKYDSRWGLLTAFAYSLLQMVTGFYPPPTQDFISFALVVLLDYVFAFGVLGLAGPVYRGMGAASGGRLNGRVRMTAACLFCCGVRFLCHFLSGILIWDAYAPAGQPVWLYSLLYNGSYMLGELLVTTAIIWVIGGQLQRYVQPRATAA